jgi:hypothetical protein
VAKGFVGSGVLDVVRVALVEVLLPLAAVMFCDIMEPDTVMAAVELFAERAWLVGVGIVMLR